MMPEQRTRFVRLLRRLADDDDAVRAKIAADVVALMRTRGLSWDDVIIQSPANVIMAPSQAGDWRGEAAALLARPDLLPAEDAMFLRKILAWRSPGADGLIRLRRIAEAAARRDRAA